MSKNFMDKYALIVLSSIYHSYVHTVLYILNTFNKIIHNIRDMSKSFMDTKYALSKNENAKKMNGKKLSQLQFHLPRFLLKYGFLKKSIL